MLKSVLEDIHMLYSETMFTSRENKGKCTIRSNNRRKILWDVFVLGLVLVVCFVVPYRLAFAE